MSDPGPRQNDRGSRGTSDVFGGGRPPDGVSVNGRSVTPNDSVRPGFCHRGDPWMRGGS